MVLRRSACPWREEGQAAQLYGAFAPPDQLVLRSSTVVLLSPQEALPPATASRLPVGRRWSVARRRLKDCARVTLRCSALPAQAERITALQHGAAVSRKLVPRSPVVPLSLRTLLPLQTAG